MSYKLNLNINIQIKGFKISISDFNMFVSVYPTAGISIGKSNQWKIKVCKIS